MSAGADWKYVIQQGQPQWGVAVEGLGGLALMWANDANHLTADK